MTVPPPLPMKNSMNARNRDDTGHDTMSIRTIHSPSLSTSSSSSTAEETTTATTTTTGRATVFVTGVTASSVRTSPSGADDTRFQDKVVAIVPEQTQLQLQPQQKAAHIVKIKINPNDNKHNGRVISTVRLTLNESDDVSPTLTKDNNNHKKVLNLVNDCYDKSCAKDVSVRISVNERKADGEPESRNTNCFYYGNSYQTNSPLNMVMSSGQCSPSDTLDSGTCSDLDGTPPPLPKKKSSSAKKNANSSGTVVLSVSHHHHHQHDRTGSLTSSGAEIDSDDNESNISCDSLNSAELAALKHEKSLNSFHLEEEEDAEEEVIIEEKDEAESSDDGLNNNMLNNNNNNNNDSESFYEYKNEKNSSESSSKASSTPRVRSPDFGELRKGSSSIVSECTYEERQQQQADAAAAVAAENELVNSCNGSNKTKYVYEDDRFYKFHLNELQDSGKDGKKEGKTGDDKDNDEYFAGYKILDREAIRSAKGTVRGVKNRVRAGIATFLQKPSTKDYRAKDAGKVVVYTTSMGIVRETYYDCIKMKQILKTHMVKFEDRDMYRSKECQIELKDRMACTTINVPQLFIDGQYIGDADTVERLNESGELRRMLKPYKSLDASTTCLFCGGYRLLPCPICRGSKRSVHRNDFTKEFVALKCMNCDEVGLIRCQNC